MILNSKILKKCNECNHVSINGNRDLCPKNCIGYKYQQVRKEVNLHCWSIKFACNMNGIYEDYFSKNYLRN